MIPSMLKTSIPGNKPVAAPGSLTHSQQDPYSPLHLGLTLPLKPMYKGGEKRKFKVKVKAENMGPDCRLGWEL